MKKFRLLLAAVLITATLSAFTTKSAGSVYYRDPNSGLIFEKDDTGFCDSHEVYACEYTPKATPVNNDPTDPVNYDPVPGTLEQVWIDLP